MTLASWDFLYFFAAVFSIHWMLPRDRRSAFQLLASYVFYAWWDWRAAGLLFLMTCVSYLAGAAIERDRGAARRHAWVLAAVAFHVGVLVYFKVGGAPLEALASSRGSGAAAWAIPLGLSYSTFRCLGYVLDVSRGLPAAERFLPYCLFVSFFAHIVAGPVTRARDLLPQLESPRDFDWNRFYEGGHLIYWGIFQKVFVADSLRPIADSVFDAAGPRPGLETLLGMYAFTLQIYADFAGYSNIARGLGKCLGLDLAENFRLPFFAQDMQEHWKRWHMSLSQWFSDFVYRPLIDMPVGYSKFYAAPFITMMIMGLWHGASVQMAVLGLYHGSLLALTFWIKSHLARREVRLGGSAGGSLPWAARALTFHLVCGGFVLLRARSLGHAASLAASVLAPMRMTEQSAGMSRGLILFAGPLLLVELHEHLRGEAGALRRLPLAQRGMVYAGMLFLLLSYGARHSVEFYYTAF